MTSLPLYFDRPSRPTFRRREHARKSKLRVHLLLNYARALDLCSKYRFHFSECQASLDVSFILDLSGSVYSVYALGMELIRKIIFGLEFRFDRSRAAFVLYSNDAYVRFHLDTYQDKRDILEALSFSNIGGRTNTQDALRLTAEDIFLSDNGDRSDVPNIVILVTDGESNIQQDLTISRAQNLKSSGTDIYVVAAGNRVFMEEVNAMATDANDVFVHRVFNTDDVITQANEILNSLC